MPPTDWSYSLLDYGVTAVALVVMGLIVWLFVRFLSNHMTEVTATLANLVEKTKAQTDEFFRLTSEVRELQRALHDHDRGG